MTLHFQETITGGDLYKRVIKKTINTPVAGVLSMMYLFSLGSFLYNLSRIGVEAFNKDRWMLLMIVLIPVILWNAFKTIERKLYEKLPKDQSLVISYEISTWYIGITDWEEREIKWADIYRMEETKKTYELYLNPTQSITIEKSIMTEEQQHGLRDLAAMKLDKKKLKNFNRRQ